MSLPPPRVRHELVAAALLVVAGLRALAGDVGWAALLGAAGLVEAGLAVASRGGDRPRLSGDGQPATLPPSAVVEQSLLGHRRAQRLWAACLVCCALTAVSLLASSPTIGAVLALLSLLCLQRVRRARRSISTLSRLSQVTLRTPEEAA